IFNRWENISGVYKLDNNYELSLNDVDITAGTTKEIYASIPEKAKLGVVSWKLEVVKLEDGKLTGIRTCITGNSKVDTYEEVKRADGSTDRQPRTVNVLQLSDLSNATTPNLSKDITEGEKNFSNLLKSSIVSDSFRVKVTSRDIYTTDFSELPLLDYDVVIVGFVDENKKLSDENGLLNKLAIAAGRGKGIIFTQDALSYFNAPSDAGHWGTKTNERIRNMLGMDRYDVGADPIANKMAFTYNLLSLFSASKYFDKYITISGTPGIENLPSADYVERINSAKIARYPYIINVRSDGFDSISGIYQTDVEENIINGKDIQQGVGYFCLSNEKVSSPTSEQEAYSISPKDIRNNYYLWRNDTVFYSGITRNAFADAGKMNELKLFVNTIISAYGLDRYVQINVKNLPSSSDYAEGKAYYLYVDMDYDSKTFEGEKNIDFDITTKNIAPTNLKMSFYRADRDGKKVVEDGSAKKLHVKMNGNIIKVGDESSGNTSVSVSEKTDYTFNYPLSFLSDADNPNIVMEVVKDLGGTEIKDTVLIRVMRRSMFELD
ncbi:MAG: hypothetical protein IKL07_00390, partial [Clostridium sp.]|nr:hypothetical protein [Clostridium sp.]